jgi:hypothetical protein
MTARRRTIPRSADDSLYERVIEVLENQKEIAKEQAAGAVMRDQLLSRSMLLLEQLTEATRQMSEIIRAHDKPIIATAEIVEKFPVDVDRTIKATCHAVEIHDARSARRMRRQAMWLPIATFLGALLGTLGRELLPFLHLQR